MEISTDDDGIVLRKVYSGVKLETNDGEYMGICMRDSGFEFNYNGQWYSAQKGSITKEEKPRRTSGDTLRDVCSDCQDLLKHNLPDYCLSCVVGILKEIYKKTKKEKNNGGLR